ncbi:hypothetical protein [Asticcacaulis endophyticus]|uniref:Uncharacterized protein n=1 Tax=Asticcacaulis endophyticus TaxID=1395890 RepID=A0A918UYS6_9CAUL|nr:hypothetical protein [Asticcacaulis endophyticus]GGZ44176.1 hypothetical protein GCM10011273_33640 [Asticcacaulis endophyticus]
MSKDLEQVEGLMNNTNPSRRVYTDDERLKRACLRSAMHIRGLWEEKGSSDTRLLEGLFIPDDLTIVGKSVNCDATACREHVVPRLVIIKECHVMLERGLSDEEIADFILKHTKIVLISPFERERLDSKDQLGMRQTMPDGWGFGDDIYARLRLADIQWDDVGINRQSHLGEGA